MLSSQQLGNSNAPLVAVFQSATNSSLPIITIIGLAAVTNGVLAQIIMSSRVLYGLSNIGSIPKIFGHISEANRTPTYATIVSLFVVLVMALTVPFATLAKITSLGLLLIFSVIQVSAIKLSISKALKLHLAIPIVGLVLNIGLVTVQLLYWLGLVA